MKRKQIWIIAIILTFVLVLSITISCIARFVFLSPLFYVDNNALSEKENYYIKKIILETVENRLSILSGNGKHLFVWINTDFMDSVEKTNDGYIIYVQTHFMESFSDDCIYEIHMDDDCSITFFGLNP